MTKETMRMMEQTEQNIKAQKITENEQKQRQTSSSSR